LAVVSAAFELTASGAGAGAGVALKCALLLVADGCDAWLLLLGFVLLATVAGAFALELIAEAVVGAVRVLAATAVGSELEAGALELCALTALLAGAFPFAAAATGMAGLGAGGALADATVPPEAGALLGALLTGVRTSGTVDKTISTGASAGGAVREMLGAFTEAADAAERCTFAEAAAAAATYGFAGAAGAGATALVAIGLCAGLTSAAAALALLTGCATNGSDFATVADEVSVAADAAACALARAAAAARLATGLLLSSSSGGRFGKVLSGT
jgi:hypothetical protein